MSKTLILLAALLVAGTNVNAGNDSKLTAGFTPQTTKGICFTENKGQVCDQNYKPRHNFSTQPKHHVRFGY